ncbi:MAG: DUF3458 domain-containing protein, partial [Rhodospirillales bacterium]
MQIPLSVGFLTPDGDPLPVQTDAPSSPAEHGSVVLSLTEQKQTFAFHDLPAEPVISVNRGFAAPVKLSASGQNGSEAILMAHDPDPFNRWEAGQQYGLSLILNGIEDWRAGKTPRLGEDYIEALSDTLTDTGLDKAFVAEAVALPSIGFVAESMQVIDIEGIDHVRSAFRKQIARRLRDRLLSIWHDNSSDAAYAPTAAQAGARSLRNMALGFLSADPENSGLARRQYRSATNMTDRMAALACLVDVGGTSASDALEDFHDRFKSYTEVLDKWFALQAGANRPDVLDQVKSLLKHPDFSMRNPNKVRSLVGSFAMRNLTAFHAADGAGYGFLADRVIELDAINPQVAARLVQPLGRWQR